MRDTLEDLYYGDLRPNERQIAPDSPLSRALERATRYEEELTALLEGDARIGDGIALFTDIRGRRLWPEGNRELKRRVRGAYGKDTYAQDDFRHEQCLVLEAGSFHVLLSGCAHNGVLNILDRYRGLYGRWPDVLISGFHMKKDVYSGADLADIRKTAQELKETKVLCWTGHCTGQRAFEEMKEILGDQLRAIHTGGVLLDTEDMRL